MSDLFNPLEFGFEDSGDSQFGHTYRCGKVSIRKVYSWRGNSTRSILPDDDWKVKWTGDGGYIYAGKIPNNKFALDLFTNLDCLPEEIKIKLKRDLALENLLN
jgi:hypothetical protein